MTCVWAAAFAVDSDRSRIPDRMDIAVLVVFIVCASNEFQSPLLLVCVLNFVDIVKLFGAMGTLHPPTFQPYSTMFYRLFSGDRTSPPAWCAMDGELQNRHVGAVCR